jgi:hypothetical protein
VGGNHDDRMIFVSTDRGISFGGVSAGRDLGIFRVRVD